MLFESPTSETLHDALVRRDPADDVLHLVCAYAMALVPIIENMAQLGDAVRTAMR